MPRGERRAQRRDDVAQPDLVEHDHVGVALDDHRASGGRHRRLGVVEPIEHLGFAEDGRLLGVEVLRLALADDAPAERDAFALDVVDGEHHAVEEPVPQLAVARQRDVCLDHLVGAKALRRQMPHKRLAAGCEPELPILGDAAPHPAGREVLARRLGVGALAAHELGVVELGGLLADRLQALPLAARRRAAAGLLGQLDMRPVRELADGLGEREVLRLHDEAERVAAGAAAETVPQLGGGVDLERGRLLVVQRAAAPEVAAALAHRRALADERDDVGRLAHFLDVVIADDGLLAAFPPYPRVSQPSIAQASSAAPRAPQDAAASIIRSARRPHDSPDTSHAHGSSAMARARASASRRS